VENPAIWQWALAFGGGLAGLYAASWVMSRAYFDNKEAYNKRLLRQLEEKTR
jgi:hypothetical protein